MLDPAIEAELESKLVAVYKADMKMHLAKEELRNSIRDAICDMLPKDSDKDDIIKAAKTIKAYNVLDNREKKRVVSMVWNMMN